MGRYNFHAEIVSDKAENPVTRTEYIMHKDKWLDEALENIAHWIGTKEEYEAQKDTIEPGTTVIITDDYSEAGTQHNDLIGRSAANAHPISAITGLQEALDGKTDVTILNFVTPEMYGAKGDGVSDDTNALQSAINSGKTVFISHPHLVSSLEINNQYTKMIGKGMRLKVSGTVNVNARYAVFDGIYFQGASGAKTENGITVKESYGLQILNCSFINFDNCIYFNGNYFWHTRLYNVEFNWSNTGARLISSNGSIDNTFDMVTTTEVKTIIYNDANQIAFRQCNFGTIADSKFYFRGGSLVSFYDCNIETDKQLTGTMFDVSSFKFLFVNCKFLINGTDNSHIFKTYEGTESVTFINCRYFSTGANALTQFWHPDSEFFKYGAVEFINSDGFPEWSRSFNGSYYPYQRNDRNGFVLTYWDYIDKTKLRAGQVVYKSQTDHKKLQYFNGTDLIDITEES